MTQPLKTLQLDQHKNRKWNKNQLTHLHLLRKHVSRIWLCLFALFVVAYAYTPLCVGVCVSSPMQVTRLNHLQSWEDHYGEGQLGGSLQSRGGDQEETGGSLRKWHCCYKRKLSLKVTICRPRETFIPACVCACSRSQVDSDWQVNNREDSRITLPPHSVPALVIHVLSAW